MYDWAGKVRTVDIAKGNMFCNVRFISSQADVIFSRLKEEHYLAGLDEDMEQGIRPIGEQFTDRSFLMSQTTKSGKNEQSEIMKNQWRNFIMVFFQIAVGTLQTPDKPGDVVQKNVGNCKDQARNCHL